MEGHLEHLRRVEIDAVMAWLKPGMRVLEIGGGNGYQASIIASLGCHVLSIDMPDKDIPAKVFYPVYTYDGHNIPAADASCDIVFSSNVLEHIQSLPPIFNEIRRVLKPCGLAVHIVPSSTWRFWTSVAHYGFVLKSLCGLEYAHPGMVNAATPDEAIRRHGLTGVIKRVLLNPIIPHGTYPNALAELYYFSRSRWVRVFEKNKFHVVQVSGNNLFYTGYGIFPSLTLESRCHMAHFLGSACHVFVMEPKCDNDIDHNIASFT